MLMMFELESSTSLFKYKLFEDVICIATETDDFSRTRFSTTFQYLFKLHLHFTQFSINETKYLSPFQANIIHFFHAICVKLCSNSIT